MDEYIKYYDDKINKDYFDQDVEMSSNTAHNPENPMEFESITEQIGNLNLTEQTHQINSSANNIQPKEEEDEKMVDEDMNQDEEEQKYFYPTEGILFAFDRDNIRIKFNDRYKETYYLDSTTQQTGKVKDGELLSVLRNVDQLMQSFPDLDEK